MRTLLLGCAAVVAACSPGGAAPADAPAPSHADAVALDLPEPATCPVGPQPAVAMPKGVAPLATCIAAVPDGPGWLAGGDQVGSALAWSSNGSEPTVYHDGDWAPLQQGLQGTGHLVTELLIAAADPGPKPLAVQIVRQVWFDCSFHVEAAEFTMGFVQSAKPGWLRPLKPILTIVNVPIENACGRYARVQLLFRLPGDSHWHRAGCTLHLYAAQPLEP